jgi:hypothetical protein
MNTCLFDKALIEPTAIVSEHMIERDSVPQRSMITCLSVFRIAQPGAHRAGYVFSSGLEVRNRSTTADGRRPLQVGKLIGRDAYELPEFEAPVRLFNRVLALPSWNRLTGPWCG